MPAVASKYQASLIIPSTDVQFSFSDTGVPSNGDPEKYTTFIIALGIPPSAEGYVPMYDTTIPNSFGTFVTCVATRELLHVPSLSKHEPEYRHPDGRKLFFQDMSAEERKTIVNIVNKALFDVEVRAAWKDTKANTWNIIWAVRSIEERVERPTRKGRLQSLSNPSTSTQHHFLMWEDENKALDVLIGFTNA
ncbi:hypothetical protein B0H17DRAFT_1184941 [Mycena rosella]|uniref:Uncharacterized protein n=1 Tax=Mycena rosella TaxID=1033263 RepID=A0AAD7CTU6_MYCRO|nr:hypothetical protein B0H17DRAFT_1184941 [Mycena rosella]